MATIRKFGKETAILTATFVIWQYLAWATHKMPITNAMSRGFRFWHWERLLHFPNESTLQRIASSKYLATFSVMYYDLFHISVMVIFVVWLGFFARSHYREVRTSFILATFTGLVIQFWTVAPPRILGVMTDTALNTGNSLYTGSHIPQMAAFPSLHITWALLIGYYIYRYGNSKWRYIAILHPVITLFGVIVTGNHTWIECIAGAILGIISIRVCRIIYSPQMP
jgi:hypothetical protein